MREPGLDNKVNDEDYAYQSDSEVDDNDNSIDKNAVRDLGETNQESESVLHNIDDGDESLYQQRLQTWVRKRASLRTQHQQEGIEEWFLPHPNIADAKLNEKFKLPGDIYPSLFDYQKTCVQWLWELYTQKTEG